MLLASGVSLPEVTVTVPRAAMARSKSPDVWGSHETGAHQPDPTDCVCVCVCVGSLMFPRSKAFASGCSPALLSRWGGALASGSSCLREQTNHAHSDLKALPFPMFWSCDSFTPRCSQQELTEHIPRARCRERSRAHGHGGCTRCQLRGSACPPPGHHCVLQGHRRPSF